MPSPRPFSVRLSAGCFLLGCLIAWDVPPRDARAQSPNEEAKEHETKAPPPVESIDAATRAMWLIDGRVVDARSGQPIESFTVTPGTLSQDDQGRTTIRWRENLERDMEAGRLRWPRTSGFSVMRFRIRADGYHPALTPTIRRGGPHLRLNARLRPREIKEADQG
jgi:hypothetical protein